MSEKLTIKEKAGIIDTSRIFDKLHLSDEFIRRFAIDPDSIDSDEIRKAAEGHFDYCDKCVKAKESYLAPVE